MRERKGKVFWTKNASQDLEEIVLFISEERASSAVKIFLEIQSKCKKLAQQPEKGRVVPELRDIGILKYREMIVGNYRIFYKSENEIVYIIAVVDGRRDIETFLFNRLIRYSG